jgi:hypothetical protein
MEDKDYEKYRDLLEKVQDKLSKDEKIRWAGKEFLSGWEDTFWDAVGELDVSQIKKVMLNMLKEMPPEKRLIVRKSLKLDKVL